MDADRIKGTARTGIGRLEEGYAQLIDDDALRAEGVGQQAAGRVQDLAGQVKDSVRDKLDRASSLADEAYSQGRRRLEQGADAIQSKVDANPVMSILIAMRSRLRPGPHVSSEPSLNRPEGGMKEKIGFAGVGLMGHGMAKNIVEKGWPLTVLGYRKRDAVEDLIGRGAAEVKTPRALAEAVDVVVLCVTGSPQVEALIQGPDGLASAGKPLLVIDCSTSEPASTIRLAEALKPQGISIVDAPLSRTPQSAWEGTLDVMVGGDPDAVARARPVIDAFAGRVIPTGPVGTGHTMKLLNNFVAMGYAALYAEALMVGAKAGLTPAVFDGVIRGGRMDSPFYQTFMRYVLERDRDAHKFTISNALKDMTYLAGFAQALGVANPVGSAVRNSFAAAAGTGHADDYVPMMSDIIASLNGVSLVSKSS